METLKVKLLDAGGAVVHETTNPRYKPGTSFTGHARRLQRKLDVLAHEHPAAVRVVVQSGVDLIDEFEIDADRFTQYVMPKSARA
jgi:metallophosphoesterase superfamily enzyme